MSSLKDNNQKQKDKLTESSSPDEILRIYELTNSLIPAAKAFLRRTRLDPDLAEDMLMQASEKVLEKITEQATEPKEQETPPINNLSAYLFSTYKHLVYDYIKKSEKNRPLTDQEWNRLPSSSNSTQEIETRILMGEIIEHMDLQSSFIFNHLLLGYSYKEITEIYNEKFGVQTTENVLRSKFSKTIKKIAKKLSNR
jgi:DNA-directed RNA polymerase specialized sigma24 family protein